jgi:hypothetical protein
MKTNILLIGDATVFHFPNAGIITLTRSVDGDIQSMSEKIVMAQAT